MGINIGASRVLGQESYLKSFLSGIYEPGIWSDATAGNDTTGTGTKTAPYLTIAKAITVSGTNGIINLKSGFYNEPGLATSINGLKIRGGYGFTPILSTATLYAFGSFTKTAGRTNVYEIAYAPAQVIFSAWHGETRLRTLSDIAGVDAMTNSAWADAVTAHKLYINVGGGAPTQTVYETHSGQGIINNYSGPAMFLDSLTFKWCDNGMLAFSGFITIANCTYNHMGAYPLYCSGTTGISVSNCTFADGNTGINSGGQSTSFINIVPASTGTYTVNACSGDTCRHGIEVTVGITLNVNDSTFSKVGNVTDGSGNGDAIISTAVVVTFNLKRCTFIDCVHGFCHIDTAGSVMNAWYCQGWLTGNVIGVNPGWGFIVDGGIGFIYHCTAANLKRNTSGGGGTGFLLQTANAGSIVKNCISYNCKVGFDHIGGVAFTEDYNCNFGNSVGLGNNWGPGAHDITTDPLFISQGTNDYHLQGGSPARNAGVYIPGVNDGFTGAAPDMGRYVAGLEGVT